MLTTQQIANELGVAYQTVMAWIYKGFFPNAKMEETPRGPYYLVPRSDLRDFKAPKRGRPAKNTESTEEEQTEQAPDLPSKPSAKQKRRASKTASTKKATKKSAKK